MKNYKMLFFILLGILLAQCKSKEIGEKFSISPPFPALNPEYTSFTFNTEKADTFTYSTGTQIFMPANIWLDSLGNDVKGDIELRYREFHRAEEIFLAGVPLTYDSANIAANLTTAGMFEIRAYQNGKNLKMKDSSEIKVRMASDNSSSLYNFYSLDDNSGKWNYQGSSAPEVNTEISKIKERITKLEAKDPFPFEKNTTFALNYNAALDIYFNNNYGKIRNNYEDKKIERKIKSYGVEMTDIYNNIWLQIKYKGIEFNVWEIVWKMSYGNKIPYFIKSKNPDLISIKYLGKDQYLMKIARNNSKVTNLYVTAVMPLKVLFSLPPNSRKAEYDKVLEKIRIERQRLNAEAAVYRTFSVKAQGYHNWDRVYHRKNRIFVKANFIFDKKFENEQSPRVYYFLDNNKTFVDINISAQDSIYMAPDSSAKYIAVLSPTQAAIFDNKSYQNLNFEEIKKQGSINLNFKSFTIKSIDDIYKLMN